ncbi:MAG: RagB/SusD family nutrient uptake outer membrane protein [Mucilaginibacter polytrichastri]|nr:RagB/SusD family nutrient uptake outer membrane protein [Mucilaginibacter polytrichastri]
MKRSIYLLLFSYLLITSCNKTLDVDSTRVVGEKNMWNSREDTRAALVGVYGLARAALASKEGHWLYGDLRGGSFVSINRQDLRAVIGNQLNAAYPTVTELTDWRRFYAVINAANLFIEHAEEVRQKDPQYSEQNMIVDVGQMRAMRAFIYYYMVRIWGDVPLITSSFDGKFENKPREDQNRVLAFAQQELLYAAEVLPYLYARDDPQQTGNFYYNEDAARWNGVLVRKLTAYAMLAHVAAWQGNYSDVARYTKFIIDNQTRGDMPYSQTGFLTGENGIFAYKYREVLWGFNFDWGHIEASTAGHLENLTLATPVVSKALPDIYVPKDSVLSIFNEARDNRFEQDSLGNPLRDRVYFTSINNVYPIFSKVKVIQGSVTTPNESLRLFASGIVFTRLEEITLLRAEALAVLGDRPGAIEMLNIIRNLRGLPNYNETANGSLIGAIFKERQRELMGEGWRWYDQVRYNKIVGNNAAFNDLITRGGIYWPISRALISQNPLLKQNAYWQ